MSLNDRHSDRSDAAAMATRTANATAIDSNTNGNNDGNPFGVSLLTVSNGELAPAGASSRSYHVYSMRWWVLLIFSLLTLSNAMMWITFSPISHFVEDHYGVSSFTVDALSLIYMVGYIPFVFLASWVFENASLRSGLLVGGGLNALSGWIRYAGSYHFGVLMFGQFLGAVAQCFIIGIPARLAFVWFGANERSMAVSIAVLANQIGVGIAFPLSTYMVRSSDDIPGYLLGQAVFVTVIGFFVWLGLKSAPPTPPSLSASLEESGPHLRSSLKLLFGDRSFMLLVVSFGLNMGVFYAYASLLSQLSLPHFPGNDTAVGWMGFAMDVSAVPGSLLIGAILDKTKAFKTVTIVFYVLTALCVMGFDAALSSASLGVAIFFAAAMGIFGNALLPAGYQYAAEISYPVKESTSSGVLNMSAQIFGIVLLTAVGNIPDRTLAVWLLFVVFFIAAALIPFITSELKREQMEYNIGQQQTQLGETNGSGRGVITFARRVSLDLSSSPFSSIRSDKSTAKPGLASLVFGGLAPGMEYDDGRSDSVDSEPVTNEADNFTLLNS